MNQTSLLRAISYHSLDMKQNEAGEMTRVLYVLFYDSGNDHFWNKLLEPDFTHCSLVQFDGIEYTLISHGTSYSYAQVLPLPTNTTEEGLWIFIKKIMDNDQLRLVKVHTVIKNKFRLKFLWTPYTCTELVKAWVGIRDYWIFTPYQLYRYFKRNGVIKNEYPENTEKKPSANHA